MACARLDDGECSGWFPVEQVLRYGVCLLPRLFNIVFAAVTCVAYMCFKADEGVVNTLEVLRKKTGVGWRVAMPGDST